MHMISIARVFGLLKSKRKRPVSLEEMQEAVEACASNWLEHELPFELLSRIDRLAARLGCSRVELINRVLPSALRDEERMQDIADSLEGDEIEDAELNSITAGNLHDKVDFHPPRGREAK